MYSVVLQYSTKGCSLYEKQGHGRALRVNESDIAHIYNWPVAINMVHNTRN